MARFIVHGGYGKTATTFLQKNVFSHLNDVLYFGKLQDGNMLFDELQRIYYTIFPSFSGMSINDIRARNSSLLIPLFGDILLREMKQAKKNIILLSNEALIDYGNYNAELNQFLLLKLFRYLQDNYDELIEFKVMMTIRNQKESLKSFYAYDFTHLKGRFDSFEQFIKYGLENECKTIFGGYHYDLVLEDMQDIYGSENVRFFVYEKMKEDVRAYLYDILEFIGTNQRVDCLDYTQKVNVNANEGVHRIREVKHGFIASVFMKMYQYSKAILQPLETVNLFQKLKNIIQTYCNKSVKVVDRGRLRDFPHEMITGIDNMYRNSNSRLSQMLNTELERYGYIGGRYDVSNHAQQGAPPDGNSTALHSRR